MNTTKGTQQGLSLVEMMIAIVISLLLMAGLIQVFVSSKAAYRFNDGISQLQEGARFAVNTIDRSFRSAGYMGCTTLFKVEPERVADTSKTGEELGNFLPSRAVQRLTSADKTYLKEAGVDWKKVDQDSGILLVRTFIDTYGRTKKPINSTSSSSALPLTKGAALQSDGKLNTYLITDCQESVLVDGTPNKKGNPKITLSQAPGVDIKKNAKVLTPETHIYYIADTDQNNDAGNTVKALYRVRYTRDKAWSDPEPLARGIEHMVIQYGFNDGDPETQVVDNYDADLSTDKGKANSVDKLVALRVALVVNSIRSIRDSADDKSDYILLSPDGTGYDPADDRLVRQVFVNTLTLRNNVTKRQKKDGGP